MLQDVCIADQQKKKQKKQGRDDSIKQFSIHPHPTYLQREKVFKVGLYVYAIICTLFPFFLFYYP